MIQRRSHRTAPRTRSLALGGALAALAVVGGGTVVAVGGPTDVDAGDIRLAQNATEQAAQGAATHEMPLGVPVDMDLEPVAARAAGGTIPDGTTVQVTGLPDGLTQNGWVISGTPSRAGEYDVLVTVSNSGISKSKRINLTVTDEGVEGATPETGAETRAAATDTEATTTTEAGATTTAEAEAEAEAGAETAATDAEATTTTDAEATTTAEVEAEAEAASGAETAATDDTDPTLSAVPGDPARSGSSGDGADGTGDDATNDDDEAVSPDLCSTLGDGQLDGDSLSQMLPMVTGDGESSGLAMILLNTVVSLLPSVLGDSGSAGDLGSAGQMLCTISPSLLGGASGEAPDEGAEDDGTTVDTGEATAGATAMDGAPLALLGMLTGGTGSAGQ